MDIPQKDYYEAQGRVLADNATDEDIALVEVYEAQRAAPHGGYVEPDALPLADGGVVRHFPVFGEEPS